jgi:hypothetical protein
MNGLPNNALQPIVGAGAAGVNRRRSALAPPSAERGRYLDKKQEKRKRHSPS